MSQIFDPVPEIREKMFCLYVNATSKVQVVRITNISNWYFERVAFPGQQIIFEAVPEAVLEVHTGMMASAILSDTIPCIDLQCDPERNVPSWVPIVSNNDSQNPISASL